MEKIEERKIVPVAAVISAGKSLLLNLILNIKFLESKTDIGTKFVNILRYNPKTDNPRFYHLKVINEKGKYTFYKDPNYETITGEENIIKENIEINKKLSSLDKVDYDDIFYMTEINNIGFLKDEQYMLTHDLCDIPGLSEYQEQIKVKKEDKIEEKINLEEQLKKGEQFDLIYKPKQSEPQNITPKNKNKTDDEDDIFYDLDIENESTYITEIYKRIKDHIHGAIIVLSIENYYFEINIEIIAKLHKVIEKKITNFLIILNKMDLSTNPKSDIESCNGFLFNAFPKCQTFNLNKNIFIPISALQVKNELLMKESFTHLLLYYFYDYKKKMKQEKNINEKIYKKTFIDYLRDILKDMPWIIKQEIENTVDDLNEKSNITEINQEIKSIIKDLIDKSNEDLDLNLGIKESDVEEDEEEEEDYLSSISSQRSSTKNNNGINNISPISIIKMIYVLHKEKKLSLQYSFETEELINYFRIKEEDKDDINNLDKNNNVNTIDLNKQIIKELEIFYNEFKASENDLKNIQYLTSEIQKLIEYLNIYDVIFIPFFGPSNAGKSTIINGIIGRDLLPSDLNECTKRGIIIGYSDEYNIIKKADFIEEEFSNQKYYYLFAKDYIIGEGDEQIKRTLKGLNYKFNDKEEDSFYYIKTKIKLFDDLGLDQSLKKMIFLIDFPGYGTGNFFKSDISKKVINICNLFIFVCRNSVIKSKETKTMLDSFINAKDGKQRFTSHLIKSSLFIFNNDINQSVTPEDVDKGKTNIQSLIKGTEKDDIKLCFFNAKQFMNYCYLYNYFYNLESTINLEYRDYTYYYSRNQKDFPSHLLDLLIEKAQSFKTIMKKKQKIDIETENIINKFFLNINEYDQENKKHIIKILSFCKENINKTQNYEESNIEEFKKSLKSQIEYINNNKQTELEESIDNVLSILDMFFGRNVETNKKTIKEISIFSTKMEELKQIAEKMINDNKDQNMKIIVDFKAHTLYSLYNRKKNIESLLSKNNYEEIMNEINKYLETNIDKLVESLIQCIESNDSECSKLYNTIKETINNFQEIKVESLTKNSFKAHLSHHFGDGKKDLSIEIMEEIKSGCESLSNIFSKKGFKEWLISLFSSSTYMINVIDMIVETYSEKLGKFVEMIDKESTNYLNRIINTIEHYIKASKMEFNDVQKKKWKELCNTYEKTKAKIMEIETNKNI